jgi:hypothetical protein
MAEPNMDQTEDTVFYRYPPGVLVGDYVRSGCGMAFALAVLLLSEASMTVQVIFGLLFLLFASFALRTLRQHILRVAVNDDGIFTKGFAKHALPWSGIGQVKLRYFGTRRERKNRGGGFMQLTLKGDGGAVTFESSIDGFRDIAWYAARAARRNGVALDPNTAGNFLGINIDADGETPRPSNEKMTEL